MQEWAAGAADRLSRLARAYAEVCERFDTPPQNTPGRRGCAGSDVRRPDGTLSGSGPEMDYPSRSFIASYLLSVWARRNLSSPRCDKLLTLMWWKRSRS